MSGISHRTPIQRQLLVDVSVIACSDARTGIQRVVRAVWLELSQAHLPQIIVRPVMASRVHGYCYAPPNFLEGQGFHVSAIPELVEVSAGDMFLGLDLAAHLLPKHEKQLYAWKRKGASLHIVIYDLLPLQNRRWFRWKARGHFKRWIGVVKRRADQAICISPTVARDFSDWISRPNLFSRRRPIPVATIQLGCDIGSSGPDRGLPADSAMILDWIAQRRTILMVGTIEPRKAYDKALAALQYLWQGGLHGDVALLIIGKPGWKTEKIQDQLRWMSSTNPRLRWLDNVTDEFLELLYSHCAGVLVTSYAEGLGLPLLEAASYGKKLLVRDLPVFRELQLENCTFFQSDTAPSLAEAINHWFAQPELDPGPDSIKLLRSWKDATIELIKSLPIE